MTASTMDATARPARHRPMPAAIATITERNLRRLIRVPTLLVFATVQPVLFVLLFTYAFGGAIHVPGVTHYIDYLLPGIFVLAIGFGASQTGVVIAEAQRLLRPGGLPGIVSLTSGTTAPTRLVSRA
jgi:hypothetical protein